MYGFWAFIDLEPEVLLAILLGTFILTLILCLPSIIIALCNYSYMKKMNMVKRKGEFKRCYIETKVVKVDVINEDWLEIGNRPLKFRSRNLVATYVTFQDKDGKTYNLFVNAVVVDSYLETFGPFSKGDTGMLEYKEYDDGYIEYSRFFRGMTKEKLDILSGKMRNPA